MDAHSGCIWCTPPAMKKHPTFPASLPANVIIYFIDLNPSDWCKKKTVFICTSLMTKEVEYLKGVSQAFESSFFS